MIRKSFLSCLLLGVALATTAAGAGTTSGTRLTPLYGNIDPFYGNIDPFYGNIDPFYGNIDPFYGNIDPFYGNIDPFSGKVNPLYGKVSPLWGNTIAFWGRANPFYGNIDPFYGNIDPFYGNIDPFYGNIDPFWGSISPFYGNIDPFWKSVGPYWTGAGSLWGDINAQWAGLQAAGATDYAAVATELQNFIATTQQVWGAAVEAGSKKSFADFLAPLLTKYGIDPNDAASLANVDARARSYFFLGLYDSLMGYSGMPRVDWWMAAINWTPALTQIQNAGTDSYIGILDSKFDNVATNVKNFEFVGGYDYYVNDHGAMVASLIASQHTAGKVMGIAPNSTILAYNPFDTTGTASWEDVAAGINALYARGAYVINASLGVPGSVLSDEWAKIMTDPSLKNQDHTFVLVKAAGNDGTMQTADVNWIGNTAPNNLILVGSVGPTGVISYFSNTPGNACILVGGTCQEQNKLMYHFIVAPGENILVSDNAGGVVRMSGTSFAAPLVTGAVALLQDRWPWLKHYPEETVDIIFRSAKDLGAPGVDPVYGWGELDVEASQSPLSFDNLAVLQPGTTPDTTYNYSAALPAASLKASLLDPGQLALWQNQGAYIVAIESIGATFRDFDIPLSSLLTGQKLAYGGEDKPFQSYLYQRLIDWAKTPGATGFTASASRVDKGNWSLSLTATAATPDELRRNSAPVHYEFAASNAKTGLGFRFGEGSGAFALNGMGFAQRSDFDPATGGVNPVLGFASGGAYGRAELALGALHFGYGFTQKKDDHKFIDPTYGPMPSENLSPNRAFASVMSVDYQVGPGFKLNASYTALREADGFLGSQGSGLFDMAQGSNTTATTVGASYAFGNWTLLASATSATSAAPHFLNRALSFTADAMNSTAYELVAVKTGLFDKDDNLRLSVAQPLHLEAGAVQYSSLAVVDRATGKLGTVTESWDVSGKREVRMEATYGLPVLDGRAQLEGYSLVDVNPHASKTGATELAIGTRLHFDL